MSGSSKEERLKKVSGNTSLPTPGSRLIQPNVIKRDGTTQPFYQNKLFNSVKNAGAAEQQASLVTGRVVNRLGDRQTVPSSQLSSMVARSLGQVNPLASSQYTSFRNQKLRSPLAPTAKGAARTIGAATKTPVPLIQKLKFPLPKVSISTAVPPQQKPAVNRIGVAPRTTVPMQQILELAKQQPKYSGISITNVPLQLEAELENLETALFAMLRDPGSQQCIDKREVSIHTQLNVGSILWYVADNTLYPATDRNGIVYWAMVYYPADGTGTQVTNFEATLEDGQCWLIFEFNNPGVVEFMLTWPGDKKTQPARSNWARVVVKGGEIL